MSEWLFKIFVLCFVYVCLSLWEYVHMDVDELRCRKRASIPLGLGYRRL